MKAILEFDLSDEDDKVSYENCINANNMAIFIFELRHNFWRKWKHGEDDFTLDNYKDSLYELMQNHDVL